MSASGQGRRVEASAGGGSSHSGGKESGALGNLDNDEDSDQELQEDEVQSLDADAMDTESACSDDDSMLAKALDEMEAEQTRPGLSFHRIPECQLPLPALTSSESHTVMFDVTTLDGVHPPRPMAGPSSEQWDSKHVKMPFSEDSRVKSHRKGREIWEKRWDVISRALQSSFYCSQDIEDAIKTYANRNWDFGCLHRSIEEEMGDSERKRFIEVTLPKMCRLALRLPELFPRPLPLLQSQQSHCVTLSQEQCASLVANAFFCTFPHRNSVQRGSEYSDYPFINFASLYRSAKSHRRLQKLHCIFNYFRRVTSSMPSGSVSFERRALTDFPKWDRCSSSLCPMEACVAGHIEDEGDGFLQADFANKFLGGGVLREGLVQEEIRFLLCPEMLVSMLVSQVLSDNEVVLMTGCERFNSYSGYGDTFQWKSDYTDETRRDSWQRLCVQVVAMDACVVRKNKNSQFRAGLFRRELEKAYCAFHAEGEASERCAIATGNWGCGAFGGDKQLKALIQLMAASACDRAVVYFTFGDRQLKRQLEEVHKALCDGRKTVKDLWALVQKYTKESIPEGSAQPQQELFDFILEQLV